MEHFITLFDSKYLPQGLALHESLIKNGDATLWVVCMDDIAFHTINSLKFESLKAIYFSDHETPELLAIKSSRTAGEYCWTFTPFTFSIFF